VLSLAYFSLHEQREVGRCRAASGILAVQGIAGGDSIENLDSGFRRNDYYAPP
jgi:hypothetical protein